jgi:hypothetical protein
MLKKPPQLFPAIILGNYLETFYVETAIGFLNSISPPSLI